MNRGDPESRAKSYYYFRDSIILLFWPLQTIDDYSVFVSFFSFLQHCGNNLKYELSVLFCSSRDTLISKFTSS